MAVFSDRLLTTVSDMMGTTFLDMMGIWLEKWVCSKAEIQSEIVISDFGSRTKLSAGQRLIYELLREYCPLYASPPTSPTPRVRR